MKTKSFASALAIGMLAAPLWSQGQTSVTTTQLTPNIDLNFFVSGASGSGYILLGQTGGETFDIGSTFFLGAGALDALGRGQTSLTFPEAMMATIPAETRVFAAAAYFAGGSIHLTEPGMIMLNPLGCERLDFDWAADGTPLQAGEEILEQWSDVGVHISATNDAPGHPDKAIVFDSANPTGGDDDLATPGAGLNNTEAFGNLLIIAENDIDGDADGLVDAPDDEREGGTVVFEFDSPVTVCRADLIDVDELEGVEIRCFAGALLLDALPVAVLGDNSRHSVGFTAEAVTRLEIAFSGSGGIAGLDVIPCPTEIDFDASTFGVPTGFLAGREITDEFAHLGLAISAINNAIGHPAKAILFDSAAPTGDDDDLATPGYGPGNDEAFDKILIIAENDVDGDFDGHVDVPDDERDGGVMIFEFGHDVTFGHATVIDIDEGQDGDSYFLAFDADDALIGTFDLDVLGDNSVQTIDADLGGVRRIELHLAGSGGLAELGICPDTGDDDPEQPQF